LGVGQLNVQLSILDIENNYVSLMESSYRTTDRGLRRDVASHQTASRTAKAAVGEECD
jgi:hypothetical protein